ncbi:hypothetical protein ACOME3_005943 [Neoechinorhynchus agilis]
MPSRSAGSSLASTSSDDQENEEIVVDEIVQYCVNRVSAQYTNGEVSEEDDDHSLSCLSANEVSPVAHLISICPISSIERHRTSARASPIEPILREGNWMNELFLYASYFIVRSVNSENVIISKQLNVWSTPPGNERRLNRAFRVNRNVILIFAVSDTHKFQGFARMLSEADHETGMTVNWRLPSAFNASSFTGIIKLDWICKKELPFVLTSHLTNSWNFNRPVKFGRDGQGIDPICGEALCRLLIDGGTTVEHSTAPEIEIINEQATQQPRSVLPFNTRALFGVNEDAFDGDYDDYVKAFEAEHESPNSYFSVPDDVRYDRSIIKRTLQSFLESTLSSSTEETSEQARTLATAVKTNPELLDVLVRGIANAFNVDEGEEKNGDAIAIDDSAETKDSKVPKVDDGLEMNQGEVL